MCAPIDIRTHTYHCFSLPVDLHKRQWVLSILDLAQFCQNTTSLTVYILPEGFFFRYPSHSTVTHQSSDIRGVLGGIGWASG